MNDLGFPTVPATRRERGLASKVSRVVTLYNPRTWKQKGFWWSAAMLLTTYLAIVAIVGIYWSRRPALFDVKAHALALVNGDAQKLVVGTATTATAIGIGETLLDKPGGYLTNDIGLPGVLLDNIPSWELGALTELRDLTNTLRNDFSRAQSQSVENKDLEIAQPQFNYNSDSWILPSSESEYRKGLDALHRFGVGLSDKTSKNAQFFARADNLTVYLEVVEKRLGSLAQRLSYAVGQDVLNTDLAGSPSARQSTPTPAQTQKKTPWLKIDNELFEAQGYTWALLHTLQAIEIDFASVLNDKNALVSLKQITRELKNTQDAIWSPMILNGRGFGPLANHSLVMANYISQVNAAIGDLRNLLQKG